jgi:hypothetical protein
MIRSTVSRVHYFDKQFLRVDEFVDEQLYQLALRRRHNVTLHTWGIASGLELAHENGALVVRPGLAIDGYGREVLLEDKKPLDPGAFDDLDTDRLDVWIVYDRQDVGDVPAGYGSCVPGASGPAYRSNEVPQVLVELPLDDSPVDARRPPNVPADVLDAAVPPMSDDPNDMWRVYLGRIIRLGPTQFTIDGSQRLYAGLVGETVDHPANPTRVEVGKQSSVDASRVIDGVTYKYDSGGEDDGVARRFAVFVPEDLPAGVPPQPERQLSPRLAILADGTIRLRGQTVVNGSVRIAGGALEFVEPVDPANLKPENAPSEPSIYRFAAEDGDQLRIDLGPDAKNKVVVIGFSSSDGKSFTSCIKLELKESGSGAPPTPLVTISGDLTIDGKLIGKQVPRLLSQEALAALIGSFQAGVGTGGNGGAGGAG